MASPLERPSHSKATSVATTPTASKPISGVTIVWMTRLSRREAPETTSGSDHSVKENEHDGQQNESCQQWGKVSAHDQYCDDERDKSISPGEIDREQVVDTALERIENHCLAGHSTPAGVREDSHSDRAGKHVLEQPMEQVDVPPRQKTVNEDQLRSGEKLCVVEPDERPSALGNDIVVRNTAVQPTTVASTDPSTSLEDLHAEAPHCALAHQVTVRTTSTTTSQRGIHG